jgi:hypothetical protein
MSSIAVRLQVKLSTIEANGKFATHDLEMLKIVNKPFYANKTTGLKAFVKKSS